MKTNPNDGIVMGESWNIETGESLAKGLTKREHFASLAMQGMLSNESGINRIWQSAKKISDCNENSLVLCEKSVAETAVAMADVLIEELNKNGD
jgi:hypothetical protein